MPALDLKPGGILVMSTPHRDADGLIVLDGAIVPKKPAKPKVKLTLAAALMLGMMLGVLIATAQVPKPGIGHHRLEKVER